MCSLSLVAVLTCALVFLQYADARVISSDNLVEGKERTLRFPGSYSLNGTIEAMGNIYQYGIWISEPLKAMKVEVVAAGLGEKRVILRGDEGTYGTLKYYTKGQTNEICRFFKGTSSNPFEVKSKLSDDELDFDHVEVIKGVEVETWVKDTDEIKVTLYVRRSQKEAVPILMVVILKTFQLRPNLRVIYDIKEYSSKPVPADVFDYGSKSSSCTEMKLPNGGDNFGYSMFSGKSVSMVKREIHYYGVNLEKREVHEPENTLEETISQLFKQHLA